MAELTILITDAELLGLGLPGDALSIVAPADRDLSRSAASAIVLGYYKKRFALPLLSWEHDTKRVCAHVAVYDLMVNRGFDPGSESGALIIKRYDDAVLWLRDVARGIVEPVDVVDSTPDLDEQGPLVSSDEPAGWGLPTKSDDLDDDCGCG